MTAYFIGLGLLKLLFIAAFSIAIYKAIVAIRLKFGKQDSDMKAKSILKERFVKGEISKEEYEEKMLVFK